PSPNQQIADRIAQNLNQSGRLRRYTIEVSFENGLAELSGTVADQSQREEAIRLVQGMQGVVTVRDRLQVAGAVTQTQAAELPRLPAPLPGPALPPGAQPLTPGLAPEPPPLFPAPGPGPCGAGNATVS